MESILDFISQVLAYGLFVYLLIAVLDNMGLEGLLGGYDSPHNSRSGNNSGE